MAQQQQRDLNRFERWLDERFFESSTPVEVPPSAPAELRAFRNRWMTRIAFRDIAGWAELDETLTALSDLADACCQSALRACEVELQQRHGAPRDDQGRAVTPVILGLGKLGGGELNFSSDIDLIFCYTAAGETCPEPGRGADGPQRLSNEEYFAKLAQAFTRLLAEHTPDGFVFRVDWMLRPFGSAGPAAMSFAAMEEYYQSHGREWERYALIKARSVAGDRAAGKKLLESLRPFVYRRYLDFNAVGHLRELKQKIDADAQRRGAGDDLKLGPGGIREVEFIVQSFQLMRGGQEPRLRDARLRPVLRYLGEAGHLSAETAQALDDAYGFLRRAENAVQMYDDQQTHRLPTPPEARTALCAALGCDHWDVFEKQLSEARQLVQTEFQRVFADARAATVSATRQALNPLWAGEGAAAFEPSLLRALTDLRDLPLVKSLNETASDRLRDALASLLEDAQKQPDPAVAALRALEVVAATVGRSTYLALLRDSPIAREHLLRLCAASPWLTRLLAQAPGLLDQLLDPRQLYAPPEKQELRDELTRQASSIAAGDTEAAMNLLRRYVQETTLRIAAADLSGGLPLVKVSDRLTWLAEAAVEQALRFAQQDLRLHYGEAQDEHGAALGLAVIAYGKFGGIELGYGSDLDLVFLYGSRRADADTVGGPRTLSHAEYFARWAQRSVNLLSARTHAGRAYEVDLELRPNGSSGSPVSSLDSFSDYQRQHAWTWEHQALTRARFVAGDTVIGEAFETLRHQVLRQPRDADKLRREILDMRAKMLDNLDKSTEALFDVKQGRGGITDIEFITQYLVLRDAPRAPALTEWSDNWRQLEALERVGSVTASQKEALIACYRTYRAWAHARSLQNEPLLVPVAAFAGERSKVSQLWALLKNP